MFGSSAPPTRPRSPLRGRASRSKFHRPRPAPWHSSAGLQSASQFHAFRPVVSCESRLLRARSRTQRRRLCHARCDPGSSCCRLPLVCAPGPRSSQMAALACRESMRTSPAALTSWSCFWQSLMASPSRKAPRTRAGSTRTLFAQPHLGASFPRGYISDR